MTRRGLFKRMGLGAMAVLCGLKPAASATKIPGHIGFVNWKTYQTTHIFKRQWYVAKDMNAAWERHRAGFSEFVNLDTGKWHEVHIKLSPEALRKAGIV